MLINLHISNNFLFYKRYYYINKKRNKGTYLSTFTPYIIYNLIKTYNKSKIINYILCWNTNMMYMLVFTFLFASYKHSSVIPNHLC